MIWVGFYSSFNANLSFRFLSFRWRKTLASLWALFCLPSLLCARNEKTQFYDQGNNVIPIKEMNSKWRERMKQNKSFQNQLPCVLVCFSRRNLLQLLGVTLRWRKVWIWQIQQWSLHKKNLLNVNMTNTTEKKKRKKKESLHSPGLRSSWKKWPSPPAILWMLSALSWPLHGLCLLLSALGEISISIFSDRLLLLSLLLSR